jgi:predicted N-acyltransferase
MNSSSNKDNAISGEFAQPLEKFSSLHCISLPKEFRLNINWPKLNIFIQYNCNLHIPLKIHPKAHLTFDMQDVNMPPSQSSPSFSISDMNRWRLKLSEFKSFDDYLSSLNNNHKRNYANAKKNFSAYGCEIKLFSDWSEHVKKVYQLYLKVAEKHDKNWFYDYDFFQTIAKKKEYQLLSAWFNGEMIAAFITLDEDPTLHSFCCGLDYNHTGASFTYSWIHYEFIKYAFQKGYQIADVGVTADDCKKLIGFKAFPVRMDVYPKNSLAKVFLKGLSYFFNATISTKGKLKIKIKNFL